MHFEIREVLVLRCLLQEIYRLADLFCLLGRDKTFTARQE
jgi:hypothetical protein